MNLLKVLGVFNITETKLPAIANVNSVKFRCVRGEDISTRNISLNFTPTVPPARSLRTLAT